MAWWQSTLLILYCVAYRILLSWVLILPIAAILSGGVYWALSV